MTSIKSTIINKSSNFNTSFKALLIETNKSNTPKALLIESNKLNTFKALLKKPTINAFIVIINTNTLASLTAKDLRKSNSFYKINSLYKYIIVKYKRIS